MKKLFLGLTLLLTSVNYANAQTVSNFENILSGSDTIWNGLDLTGGKRSASAFFVNEFNTQWGSWSGFSVSKTTDTLNGTWANQYSCIAGAGANGSLSYGVAYSSANIIFTYSSKGDSIYGMSLNNSTYTYKKILNGDAFAKKFGGTTGNDSDFYSVTFYGYDADYNLTDSVQYFLADYRFTDNSKDYIINDWTWVDLKSLGKIRHLELGFNSSDKGQFGINTPTYACIDSLVYKNTTTFFQPITQNIKSTVGYNSQQTNYNLVKNSLNPSGETNVLISSIIKLPKNGLANQINDSVISYEPNIDFNGIDTIWFSICNQSPICDTGFIEIIVNDIPTAKHDTFFVKPSIVYDFEILKNDWDEKKSDLTVNILDNPKQGNAFVSGTFLTYMPSSDFKEIDSCKYLICDKFGECDSSTAYFLLDIGNLLTEKNNNQKIKIYPNPTTGVVNWNSQRPLETIVLTDFNGRKTTLNLNQKHQLDLSNFPKGNYIISFITNNSTEHIKVIKQ